MKKIDVIVFGVVIAIVCAFVWIDGLSDSFMYYTKHDAYVMSFLKFAVLATFGEALGLRIRTGNFNEKGFGILPRAIIWGVLGVMIKMAFTIFGTGAPAMLQSMGVEFPAAFADNPSAILRESIWETSAWKLHLLSAFSVSVMLNIFFAPFFMTIHKISDEHILRTGGTLHGLFSPWKFGLYMKELNWGVMYHFVFKKTIPLFWIPAQTLNFMLPPDYRILVAAFYGVILGIFMAIAALKSRA